MYSPKATKATNVADKIDCLIELSVTYFAKSDLQAAQLLCLAMGGQAGKQERVRSQDLPLLSISLGSGGGLITDPLLDSIRRKLWPITFPQ